jgi:hypothetical protein
MRECLRLARPFLVLVLLFAAGRWAMGTAWKVPYEKGHHILSLVTLTWMAAAFYGAFTRKWRGFTVGRAALMGATLGLVSQLVIVLATALTYALGIDTYFNHPTALNVMAPIAAGEALGRRAGGLVVNALIAGILGALGWFLGGTLPEARKALPEERVA